MQISAELAGSMFGDASTTSSTGYCEVVPHSLQEYTYTWGCSCKKDKEENMEQLWEIWLIYTGDGGCPVVTAPACGYIVAKTEETAKLKSGVYQLIKPEWDMDYVTIYAKPVCQVKIRKEKEK